MRVRQSQRAGPGAAARGNRRTTGRGSAFRPSGADASKRTAALRSGPAAVASLDAILSLQSVEGEQERRRRAVSQGREVLELLDELKVGVLSGRVSEAKLANLERAVGRYQGVDGDPGLKDVLQQIDLRARVELAKLRRSAA